MSGSVMFLVRSHSSSSACDLRSSGARPSPASMARSGRPGGKRHPVDEDLAAVAAVDAVDRAQQLAAPGADEPGDPQHLAGAAARTRPA